MTDETKPKKIAADPHAFARITDYGQRRSLWVFSTRHALTDVCAPDFFLPILEYGPRRGDIIEVTCGIDPAEATYATMGFDNVDQHRGAITTFLIRRSKATPCRVKLVEAA